MTNFIQKIEHSKEIIAKAIAKHPKIAVACSFGKDSMATVHLAKQIAPQIKVFSVMTKFKPPQTLKYLTEMNQRFNLDLTVYMVADQAPPILAEAPLEVVLLSPGRFQEQWKKAEGPLYRISPDLCCKLLKVEPTKEAVKGLLAWISGLRQDEGYTRLRFQEFEEKDGLMKVNPILAWSELDVWRYLALNNIPVNPLYAQGYRSLGCAPCSKVISDDQPERAGRWQDTSKCGGECGIHTQSLRKSQS